MEKKELRNKIEEIFKEILPDLSELSDNTSSGDVQAWDSLNHVMLISKIENQFNIKFELTDMLSMQNFGEICRAVETKLQENEL